MAGEAGNRGGLAGVRVSETRWATDVMSGTVSCLRYANVAAVPGLLVVLAAARHVQGLLVMERAALDAINQGRGTGAR
jgi:hypothetical protein